MKEVFAVILVCFVVGLGPPAARCTVEEEEDAPQYLYVTSAVLAGANLFSVFGNTTGLVTRTPNRAFAYLGVVGGALSIGFAFVLEQEEPRHDNMPIFFGVTGGLALGLGAFNLQLARHLGETRPETLSLSPALIWDGRQYVGGMTVSVDF